MRRKMKKIAIVLVLLAGAGGFWAWRQMQDGSAEAAVKFDDVILGTIEETVTAQGRIEPKDSLDVGTQVSGQLKKLYVEVGALVSVGDPLAEIDPRIYQSRLAADEASLKVLRAQYGDAKASMVLAEQKHKRNLSLQKSKFVSDAAIEETAAALDKASAGIDSLTAQIEKMQSTLDEDRLNLGYTNISAPRDGVVVDIPVKEGQTLNASQTSPTVLTIADLDTMTVWAQVSEADVMKVSEGMEVSFTTLGDTTQKRKGRVRQVMPTPEIVSEVVLYNVLIDVDNRDRRLMNGMSAQVFFTVAKAANVPLVPVSALGRRMEDEDQPGAEAYVVRVWQGGQAVDRTVLVGLMNRVRAEVKSGLAVGDRVVVGAAKTSNATGAGGPSANVQASNQRPGMMGGLR
ncbi:MAG TPA: efflux RND transporter periplasmic adaptor subunit [Rhodospirillaceae bacterium]|nr:MAG: hypothetical protein A2018_06270 [Alphaproteobacteria bacterium GWF2_58_20]HAU29118.1 efflux RND transporter periplasmic adaptor subunit [Rhodospirillaceae bacterium]